MKIFTALVVIFILWLEGCLSSLVQELARYTQITLRTSREKKDCLLLCVFWGLEVYGVYDQLWQVYIFPLCLWIPLDICSECWLYALCNAHYCNECKLHHYKLAHTQLIFPIHFSSNQEWYLPFQDVAQNVLMSLRCVILAVWVENTDYSLDSDVSSWVI